MTSDVQIEANRENSLNSTGPIDCSSTRFNAVKFGLTGENYYSPEEEATIQGVFKALQVDFKPIDLVENYALSCMAKAICRHQRITHLQQAEISNNLICKRNLNRQVPKVDPELFSDYAYTSPLEPHLTKEEFGDQFEILHRYETSNENKLLKWCRFLIERRKG